MDQTLLQMKVDYYNSQLEQAKQMYELLKEYQANILFEIDPKLTRKFEFEAGKQQVAIQKKEAEIARAKADVERYNANIATYQLDISLYIGEGNRAKLPSTRPSEESDATFNLSDYGAVEASKSELETLISERANYTDPIVFLEEMKKRVLGVGRVEANGKAIGTAILVGKGKVLTNWHVVRKSETDDTLRDLKTMEVRFGHYMSSRTTTEPGVAFKVAGLLGSKSAETFDYALLELAEDPSADDKFKIITPSSNEPTENSLVNILHHPNGQPMKLSYQDNWVKIIKNDRVLYMTNTEPGSSGSPVFNDNWELVALHHSGKPYPPANFKEKINANEGIVMSFILEDLDKSGWLQHIEGF